jgi:putative acetyltransferase
MKVQIRKIKREDNPAVARIIRNVMPEFGASGFGFAIHDAEVENIYDAYQAERSAYYVCDVNGQIVGGGGIAPLLGGDPRICELKKMYFLSEARGKGYGQMLLRICIKEAHDLGFDQCYLETFHTMKEAIKLYEKNGFKKIPSALGNTGHFACDTFFLLTLEDNKK